MQKKKTMACLVAVLAAVVLAVLRIVAMPRIVNGDGGVWNTVLFILSPAVVAVLLLLSDKRPSSMRIKSGPTLLAVASLFTGVAMLVSSFSTYTAWRNTGVLPYPSDKAVTPLSTLFVSGLVLFGLLSGVFFVLWGVLLYRGKRLKAPLALLAFAPLVWVWMRVCQYEISYYSSLTVFRHWYDLLLLLLEMVFFVWMTRYLLRTDKPPRLMLGMSLSVGAVAIMACATRVAMVLLREQEAFVSCGLLSAADLGVALLAFGFAFAWHPADEDEAVQLEEEEQVVPAEQEDTQEEYLIAGITVDEEDEDEADFTDIHAPRKPLELEDVLQDIFQHLEDKEK